MKKLIFTDNTELPVGTMYGIGQNYDKHAREMDSKLQRGEKIIFIKPSSSYVPDGGTLKLPSISNEVHHEVEVVVVIGKECQNVSKENAWDYIAGFGVGIDATLRDLQKYFKEKGLPWAIAKGFRTSAPISKIVPVGQFVKNKNDFEIELYINGELRQVGNTIDMIYSIEELIEYLSSIYDLEPGDIIFTGTPEGIGKLNSGDKLQAKLIDYINGNTYIDLNINVE
jgi:2-keto-4-pentenoate hydratase/2-oxohepta-3-ene-1,7-dioic acid hydratase in catechol pathway